MQETLCEIVARARAVTAQGAVASYIPKLSEADPRQLGAYVMDVSGRGFGAGEWERPVTIQSIVKVAVFMLALTDCPAERLLRKISLNATAEGFNSIVDLETKNKHKPLNPYINSGAIACIGLLGGDVATRFDRVRALLCRLTGNEGLRLDEEVYLSEKSTGDRNRAIAYYMRSTGILEDDVDAVLDAYFRLCSIRVNCRDLAAFGATLANGGISPLTGAFLAPRRVCRTALTVMASCGLYDESGDYLVRTGMPGKSGVGGGIMAAVPRTLGVGVIGPALNEKGNSIGGMEVLSRLSEAFGLSIL